jgi:hypothetical protein
MDWGDDEDGSAKVFYMTVPLLFRLSVPVDRVSPSFFLGPSIGVKIHDNSSEVNQS